MRSNRTVDGLSNAIPLSTSTTNEKADLTRGQDRPFDTRCPRASGGRSILARHPAAAARLGFFPGHITHQRWRQQRGVEARRFIALSLDRLGIAPRPTTPTCGGGSVFAHATILRGIALGLAITGLTACGLSVANPSIAAIVARRAWLAGLARFAILTRLAILTRFTRLPLLAWLAIAALLARFAIVLLVAAITLVAIATIVAVAAVIAIAALLALLAGIVLIVVIIAVIVVGLLTLVLLLEPRAAFAQHAEIMIGELVVIFGVDAVALALRVAREVLVLFEQLGGIAARAIVDAVAGVASAAGILRALLLPAAAATATDLTIVHQGFFILSW